MTTLYGNRWRVTGKHRPEGTFGRALNILDPTYQTFVSPYDSSYYCQEAFNQDEYERDRCICMWFPEDADTSLHCEAERVYWYHPDYLGHTCPERSWDEFWAKPVEVSRRAEFVTDEAGRPYQYFAYMPFGEPFVEQHAVNGFYSTPYRFSGKEYDEHTGQYYYGARYQDPLLGIWLSPDPMFFARPSLTPYNFVQNNPIMLMDPTGLLDNGGGKKGGCGCPDPPCGSQPFGPQPKPETPGHNGWSVMTGENPSNAGGSGSGTAHLTNEAPVNGDRNGQQNLTFNTNQRAQENIEFGRNITFASGLTTTIWGESLKSGANLKPKYAQSGWNALKLKSQSDLLMKYSRNFSNVGYVSNALDLGLSLAHYNLTDRSFGDKVQLGVNWGIVVMGFSGDPRFQTASIILGVMENAKAFQGFYDYANFLEKDGIIFSYSGMTFIYYYPQ